MKRFTFQQYVLLCFVLVGAIPTVFLGVTQVIQPMTKLQQTFYTTLSWCGFALLLAAVFGAFLTERVLAPVQRLTQGIKDAAKADFSHPVDSSALLPKEIAELTREFNEMISRLQESYSCLEQKVEERTRELADVNRKIRHQNEILAIRNQQIQEASRAKGQFLANMSHELRTPLNGINGFAQMLQRPRTGALSDKQARYVANILSSGRHLLGLVNDILDLSKIDAAKLHLDLEYMDLSGFAEEVLTIIRPLAVEKGIALSAQIDPHLPKVFADAKRVRQILFNLLSNAVKFTLPGGQVHLVAEPASDSSQVRLAVHDTGIGIPAEEMEHLFEEFHQIDSSISRQQQGTGLGLALTKKLVTLHNGSIAVESTVEKGSTFTVCLPISPKPVYVLLVEDQMEVADLFTRKLHEDGFEVIAAASGNEGLEKARETSPDLIFLDMTLPDRSGFEILKTLRNDPKTAPIPVIVMASDSLESEADIRNFIKTTVRKGDFTFQRLLANVNKVMRISA